MSADIFIRFNGMTWIRAARKHQVLCYELSGLYRKISLYSYPRSTYHSIEHLCTIRRAGFNGLSDEISQDLIMSEACRAMGSGNDVIVEGNEIYRLMSVDFVSLGD